MYTTTADEGFQLFHRAIVLQDSEAWCDLHARYRQIMCAWARRNLAFDISQERCEDIADEALERAWLALAPEHFQSFTGLPAVLAYLRACVASAVIDSARKQQFLARASTELDDLAAAPFEELIVEQLDRTELSKTFKRTAAFRRAGELKRAARMETTLQTGGASEGFTVIFGVLVRETHCSRTSDLIYLHYATNHSNHLSLPP